MAKLPHITTTTSPVAYRDEQHNSRRNQQAPPPVQPPHMPQGNDEQHQIVWQMAHELRLSLTSIKGFAQLLLDPKSSKPLDQQQQSYVAHILDAGEYLLSIIKATQEFATVRSGHIQLTRAPLDPRALFSTVRDQLAPLAMEKSQCVTIQIGEELAPLNADQLRMRQVLLNLLGNAIKFAPAGSQIVLGAQPAKDGAMDFFVQNQGPIIPRAYHRSIFAPFVQVPPLTSDDTPHGAGLGLAIAQELVHLHGGTIWVRSNQRHGTTFWVRLPR